MPRREAFTPIHDLLETLEKHNSRAEFSQIHRTFSPVPVSRLEELQPRELERLACWAYQNLGYSYVVHSGAHSSTDGAQMSECVIKKGIMKLYNVSS